MNHRWLWNEWQKTVFFSQNSLATYVIISLSQDSNSVQVPLTDL